MLKYLLFAVLGAGLFARCVNLGAQQIATATQPKSAAAPTTPSKPDYSKEAFIDEQDSTKIVAENDGTSTRVSSTRIRIQSDAGVQRFGVLTFSYQNATESITIDYVRVLKPDATVIVTPADNVQDMPAEITRLAPFYSDLREKHVAVKGLSVGDVLEYQVRWQIAKPLAPGQFWFAFNPPRESIVLNWEFQVSIPHDRAVKWRSPSIKPVITEYSNRRIFDWTGSRLETESAEQEKKDQEVKLYQSARGKLPPAEIQISTFQTWEQVGAWYKDLQQDRVKPSAEIRSKAAELTRNAADDNAKLHAIYNYVSTQFRYIGVAFGIGRYQPHSAPEVLANQYGDCKDKHTLLASLLESAGIKAYPALISTSHELDPDVPSPLQFDHVMTAIPQGGSFIWLDTTAEVAPYGYLLSPLWDKQALVIPADKSATFVTTPAEPAIKAVETFHIDAKLKDDGTLEGKIERSFRGDDAEVLLRAAFRRLPMTQWKDLIQQISYASRFSGEVSDVSASPPEKTDEAFRFSYTYTRKDFPQWSERRIGSPLPPIIPTAPDEKPGHPILLGVVEEKYQSRVELPKGYTPELPEKVDLSETFGEYHASYSVKDEVLQTDRQLVVKQREVPVSEYDEFTTFAKSINHDDERYISLSRPAHVTPSSLQDAVWKLPYSNNPEAARAYDDARNEYKKHNTEGEIAALKRAVQIDPKFTRAWLWIAEVYKFQRNPDLAVEAYRSAIANDPQQPLSYKGLGFAFVGMRKYEDAILVWQQLIKLSPADADGPANLALALSNLKRYNESASALQSAIELSPDRAELHSQLGMVYLHDNREDSALAEFKKALEMDAKPDMFNNIGYELADAGKELPLALQYIEEAVKDEEALSTKVNLANLNADDLRYTISLDHYWDSLGWVYFRLGNLDKAEKYLNAAWSLSQGAVEGDHLAQVYEQEHRKDDAVKMYRLALGISRSPELTKGIQERLVRCAGAGNAAPLADQEEQLKSLRTFALPPVVSDDASAEFFLLLGSDSKVQDVAFISGSEKLKSADKVLSSTAFKIPLPDDGPTKVLRRGMLSCAPTGGCNFVFYTASSVRFDIPTAIVTSEPPSNAGGERVNLSQGITQGMLIHKVQPIYPENARRNRIQGTVLLRAVIGKDGRIRELTTVSGPEELVGAAVDAVQQWLYRPYEVNNQPVEVETHITVNFQLKAK